MAGTGAECVECGTDMPTAEPANDPVCEECREEDSVLGDGLRNHYMIRFRPDADTQTDAMMIQAHRVEGWDNDYAFYGHHTKLDEVTRLVPREIVRDVKMEFDSDGLYAESGINPDEE